MVATGADCAASGLFLASGCVLSPKIQSCKMLPVCSAVNPNGKPFKAGVSLANSGKALVHHLRLQVQKMGNQRGVGGDRTRMGKKPSKGMIAGEVPACLTPGKICREITWQGFSSWRPLGPRGYHELPEFSGSLLPSSVSSPRVVTQHRAHMEARHPEPRERTGMWNQEEAPKSLVEHPAHFTLE